MNRLLCMKSKLVHLRAPGGAEDNNKFIVFKSPQELSQLSKY